MVSFEDKNYKMFSG